MRTIKITKIFAVSVLGLFCLSLLLWANQNLQSEQTDGKKGLVTYTDGRVKKKADVAADWENALKDTPVNTGDRVRTYQSSRAELELLKLDVIRMAPETTIDVVKLYEETKGQVKETKLNLEKGDIWAKINQKDASMKFDISTPIAGAAITGTVFRMGVQGDSTTELKVYHGEVKITNAPENTNLTPQTIPTTKPYEIQGPREIPGPKQVSMDEWIYIVKNMQRIQIGPDGKVQSVGGFKLSDQSEQTDWVKWNMERDKVGK
jgi:hypothetical protein